MPVKNGSGDGALPWWRGWSRGRGRWCRAGHEAGGGENDSRDRVLLWQQGQSGRSSMRWWWRGTEGRQGWSGTLWGGGRGGQRGQWAPLLKGSGSVGWWRHGAGLPSPPSSLSPLSSLMGNLLVIYIFFLNTICFFLSELSFLIASTEWMLQAVSTPLLATYNIKKFHLKPISTCFFSTLNLCYLVLFWLFPFKIWFLKCLFHTIFQYSLAKAQVTTSVMAKAIINALHSKAYKLFPVLYNVITKSRRGRYL